MTTNHTRILAIEPQGFPLEALYPRERFIQTETGSKPVFLGHPNGRCDICEARFGATLQHPESDSHEGLVVICGGHLMRLTTATS